jgi:hypothetical protein
MSSNGVPDCSRAARLIVKDVIANRLPVAYAPPTMAQADYDRLTAAAHFTAPAPTAFGASALQHIQRRKLLTTTAKSQRAFDAEFFARSDGAAHVKGECVRASCTQLDH